MPDDKQMLESALLVTRWQRGDRTAFEGLVKLWEQPLFYYLRRLANSEADAWELLQETWLKILRSLKTLRDPMALPSFLYTTARNTAINRLRGTKYAEQLDALDNEDKSLTRQMRLTMLNRFIMHSINSPSSSAKRSHSFFFRT
jgi:RNA polymerase sigma-70 factor (ECF subfamily)